MPPFDIPPLTVSGVLPPWIADPRFAANMSPYQTSLVKIANSFCSTADRCTIFNGLLQYRQALAGIGLTSGFQWLSGSFLEDIETLENRPPRDVDVVTFCQRPAPHAADPQWQAFVNANRNLWVPAQTKAAYRCDAHFVDLSFHAPYIVDNTRSWFGLFSHRRNGIWKGMLQVPLAISQDDADASQLVNAAAHP